jgi:excisionase family DNA binding protein
MNSNDPIPRLLKIGEVAAILQISRTSAYRLAASGELPSVRFSGATVRIRPGDLEQFIEASLCNDHNEIAA